MKFGAIALAAGLVGSFVVSSLQGATIVPASDLGAPVIVDAAGLDAIQTGSVRAREAAAGPSAAARLIDLQNGSTCRLPDLSHLGDRFEAAELGAGCQGDPTLTRVALWRAGGDGTLEMADSGGTTLLRFQPGDGVLFESIYPLGALVTIVPVKG